MDRIKAVWATLYATALALWAMPALALAQGATTGRAPTTGGAAAPASTPTADTGGGSGAGWLWIVAALVVLALIWWAMSTRRRHGTVTR